MKFKRKVLIIVCCIAVCLCIVGCEGEGTSGDSKSIKVDGLNSIITFSNVNFYDFLNEVKKTGFSGKCEVVSGTLGSTQIFFYDTQGCMRVAEVDTALTKKPSKVKLYTNSKKTSYDTYECEY